MGGMDPMDGMDTMDGAPLPRAGLSISSIMSISFIPFSSFPPRPVILAGGKNRAGRCKTHDFSFLSPGLFACWRS